MVVIGDKLGARYFVTKTVEKPVAGSIVEVRDALGSVFQAQMLLAAPLGTPETNLVAREVASVPRSALLCLPDEIAQATSGVPFALYSKPLPRGLAEELPVFASGNVPERKLSSQRALFAAFAALAEEYGRAVGARSLHGSIALNSIGVLESGETLKLALMGFGLEPAARIAAKKERPAPRVDPAALLLTLHDALTKIQCVPEGGAAQAKWSIAQSCARAGDHPALQSPIALSKFLRDIAVELESTRRSPTIAPRAGDKSAEKSSEPVAGAKTSDKPADKTSDKPAEKTSEKTDFKPAARAWIQGNRRTALVGGVGVAVVLVVAGFTLLGDGSPIGHNPTPDRVRIGGPTVPLACGDEPVSAPSTAEFAGAITEVSPACASDNSKLYILGESGHSLALASREPRRGNGFSGTATPTTDRAVELGTTLTTESGAWLAWRPRDGAAFAITRLGPTPEELPLRTGAWTGAGFHGAWLLDVGPTSAWIASTLDAPNGPLAVAVRLTWGASTEAPVAVFQLSEGEVASLIQASPPQLLVHTKRERQHAFSVITTSIQVLPVLAAAEAASPDGGVDDGGLALPTTRVVPEVALHRTGSFTVEGDFATAAPYGIAPPNSPIYFTLTSGHLDDASTCTGPRCAREGSVALVSFPATGDPSAQILSDHGRALDLGLNPLGQPVALVCEAAACALMTRVGVEGLATETISLRGLVAGHTIRCGAEPWLTFATSATPSHLGALPIACLSRRASAH
jgi:hypothetical protein